MIMTQGGAFCGTSLEFRVGISIFPQASLVSQQSRLYWPAFFSMCPPNWKRMAERILPAKSSSPREAKRWKSDAVSTGAGVVDSIAARTVQRPSPESETRPEKDAGPFSRQIGRAHVSTPLKAT